MMIQIQESNNTRRIWDQLPFFYVIAAVIVLIVSLYMLFFSHGHVAENFLFEEREQSIISSQFDYSSIGEGPLCLQSDGIIPNLKDEIAILARNRRPDQRGKEASLLLLLRSAHEQIVVTNGEKLFLKWVDDPKGAKLQTAKQPTSLWIIPFLMEGSSVLIEVGLLVRSKESAELSEEKMQFVLEEVESRPETETSSEFIRALLTAKWWGRDLFYDRYGGSEYSYLGKKQKLEISLLDGTTLLFVAPGDNLVWQEGRWELTSPSIKTTDKPLAYVKMVSDKALEIEVWDEGGFYPMKVTLHPQSIPKLMVRPEQLPSSLRLRTRSQVTSFFGKRRVVLREGDWLLKLSTGWHILRTAQEIEACLKHKMVGELFVFDRIELEGAAIVVKGHLFDEMRTQVVDVALAVSAEKKENKMQRGKKRIFTPNQKIKFH